MSCLVPTFVLSPVWYLRPIFQSDVNYILVPQLNPSPNIRTRVRVRTRVRIKVRTKVRFRLRLRART